LATLEELLGRGSIVGHQPVDALLRGDELGQGSGPLLARRVQKVDSVAVEDVEEEHRQRLRGAGTVDVDAASEPRSGDLELVRTPVCSQRDRLAVGDERADGQRERRGDHLGKARGDVVEAARVDRHVVAVAVDLDPRAVELRLEHRFPAEALERVVHPGRGLREHRADGPTDAKLELTQRLGAAGKRSGRNCRKGTAEHGGAPNLRSGHVRGAGYGVGHDADQRALPEVAAQQPAEEGLLDIAGRAEQRAQCGRAPGLRALARYGLDLGERRVDAEDGQRGRPGRGRQRPQGGVTDADLALRKFAGQPRHDDRDLVRLGSREQRGDSRDLGQPRRRGADLGGRGGDVDQQHALSLARPDDSGRPVSSWRATDRGRGPRTSSPPRAPARRCRGTSP
jgi:hypothetical protein